MASKETACAAIMAASVLFPLFSHGAGNGQESNEPKKTEWTLDWKASPEWRKSVLEENKFQMETASAWKYLERSADIDGGGVWLLSFKCRSDDPKCVCATEILASGTSLMNCDLTTAAEWRQIKLMLPKSREAQKATIRIYKKQSGTLFVSDISLRRLETPARKDWLLADFELDSDVIDVDKFGKIDIERSVEFASRGLFSLKVSYDGKDKPVARFQHLEGKDILGYKSVECDVFNPSMSDCVTYPVMEIPPNVIFCHPVTLKANSVTSVEVGLHKVFNEINNKKNGQGRHMVPDETKFKVSNFYFYGPCDNDRKYNFYIDNIWLKAEKKDGEVKKKEGK